MESFRKLATACWVRLVAYEDAVLRAIQAYNEYVFLRHQSETNLRRRGLKREDVSSEVFRKHYGDPTSAADGSPLSGAGRSSAGSG
jgi:hypothetical protein